MREYIYKILKYIMLLLVAILLQMVTKAQLSVSITGRFEGCAPQILSFGCNVNGATGEVSYSWTSGNGDVSVLAEPTFSYLTPGRYTISVTASSGGQTATDSHEIVIFNGPTASFNDSTIVGCVSRGYLFQSSSTAGDAEITNWLWYFGDGVSAQGRYRAHTYTSPGVYTVSLEVTDANGCRDEYHSQMLTLSKRPEVSITANNAQWCVAPHEVNFSSEISTDVGLGGPYTATWDFGDGTESNDVNPSHTYENTGSYNVTLTVVDSYGCTSVVQENNMVVIGTLTPTCTVPTEMCLNTQSTFRSNIDDELACYWDFGDGTALQWGAEASHTYSQVGNYSVSFTADPERTVYSTVADRHRFSMSMWWTSTHHSAPNPRTCFHAHTPSMSGLLALLQVKILHIPTISMIITLALMRFPTTRIRRTADLRQHLRSHRQAVAYRDIQDQKLLSTNPMQNFIPPRLADAHRHLTAALQLHTNNRRFLQRSRIYKQFGCRGFLLGFWRWHISPHNHINCRTCIFRVRHLLSNAHNYRHFWLHSNKPTARTTTSKHCYRNSGFTRTIWSN